MLAPAAKTEIVTILVLDGCPLSIARSARYESLAAVDKAGLPDNTRRRNGNRRFGWDNRVKKAGKVDDTCRTDAVTAMIVSNGLRSVRCVGDSSARWVYSLAGDVHVLARWTTRMDAGMGFSRRLSRAGDRGQSATCGAPIPK